MTRTAADLLFRPRSIVVYGASSDPDKLSGRPLQYLRKFGYRGDLHAVNPNRGEVQGVSAHDRIEDVPGPPELAIIVVPAESVLDALERSAAVGVGAAIVFASGFAEVSADHGVAQKEMTALARRTGMRILGPNCLGSFAGPTRAFATFSTAFDDLAEQPDFPIGIVSQSGAVGTFTFSTMCSLGLGVRYFANTGNEADISAVELLTDLAESPDVEIVLGHMERTGDLDALEHLVSTAGRNRRPLLLLKAGKSDPGSRAVGAHTSSVPGDDQEFDRILAAHGAIRPAGMEAMADAALAFASGRRAAGPRLTIVTLSGGAGALAADAAAAHRLVVRPWRSEAARAAVGRNLPYFGSTANPIDVTGAMITDVGILERTLEVACDNEETDVVLVILGNADKVGEELVAVASAARRATEKPFFVAWTGGSGRPRQALLEAGVPTYPDPLRAVEAISLLVGHSLRNNINI